MESLARKRLPSRAIRKADTFRILPQLEIRPFKFSAVIAGAGIVCYDSAHYTSDVPAIDTVYTGRAPWMCDASDTRDRKGSPIRHMQNVRSPVLILHGEKDPRCPVGQAVAFHRGLKARGKECEMVIYTREGHGFLVI